MITNRPTGQVISLTPTPTPEQPPSFASSLESTHQAERSQFGKLRETIATLQTRQQQATALIEAMRAELEQVRLTGDVLESSAKRKHDEMNRCERRLQAEITTHRERALQAEIATQRERSSMAETAARNERALQAEAAGQRRRGDELQKDLAAALRALEQTQAEQKLKANAASEREERLCGRIAQLQEALKKCQSEIELYKSSWTQVLQAEREAREHLKTKTQTAEKIRTLERRNQELLDAADSRVRALEASAKKLTHDLRKEATNAACALRSAEEERARADAAQAETTELRARLQSIPAPAPSPAASVSDAIVTDISDDFERISGSRMQLEQERDRLRQELEKVRQEALDAKERADRMKRYPLRDLLLHKESELMSAVRELKKIPSKDPAYKKAEDIVATLADQRDQLRAVLRESELGR